MAEEFMIAEAMTIKSPSNAFKCIWKIQQYANHKAVCEHYNYIFFISLFYFK